VCTYGTAISTNEEASSGLWPCSVLRLFGRLYSTAPTVVYSTASKRPFSPHGGGVDGDDEMVFAEGRRQT
jgi:hypothetical protein